MVLAAVRLPLASTSVDKFTTGREDTVGQPHEAPMDCASVLDAPMVASIATTIDLFNVFMILLVGSFFVQF